MAEGNGRATSDPAARKKVLKQVADEGVEFVHLWFTDIEGHLKGEAKGEHEGRKLFATLDLQRKEK